MRALEVFYDNRISLELQDRDGHRNLVTALYAARSRGPCRIRELIAVARTNYKYCRFSSDFNLIFLVKKAIVRLQRQSIERDCVLPRPVAAPKTPATCPHGSLLGSKPPSQCLVRTNAARTRLSSPPSPRLRKVERQLEPCNSDHGRLRLAQP